MKCPKCKTEVTSKDTLCPNCGLRLVIECPKCKEKLRLGSASCKKCGYVFVKFCPKCNSANYVSSPTCRKCFYVFEEVKEKETTIVTDIVQENKPSENKREDKEAQKRPKALFMGDGRLEIFIDFINLPDIFKKYNDNEFKNKVTLNIKTSIKVAFGATAEFYKENIARFKVNYNKNNGISGKIAKFNDEMLKFNNFLSETLGSEISHKFVILQSGEIAPDKTVMQLALGKDKDIITSKAAFDLLSSEISLVKISPDSYKMANLENEDKKIKEYKETDETVVIDMVSRAVLENNNIKGISINAPRGAGKSHILSLLIKKLENSEFAILTSNCSAASQVAPMGLFQDLFLNLFSLPFAPENYEEVCLELRGLIKKYLPDGFDSSKIETLINLVYPVKEAYYETILKNKEKTFLDLKDILEALRANSKVLLIVDDFDLIDETSFEFLNYLVKNNFFVDNSKFLLCYRNQNSINMYIPREILPKENCLDITLQKRELASIRGYIKRKLGEVSVLPRKISDQIILNAKGDLAYAGQVLYHFLETKKIRQYQGKPAFSKADEDYLVPATMSEIVAERLNFLYSKSKAEFLIVCLASFLGGKFSTSVIKSSINMEDDIYSKAISNLETLGYITKVQNGIYIFKNSLLWTHVYIFAKENEEIKEYIPSLLKVLLARKISSPAICALLAQSAENKELALNLWTKNLKLASYIGDCALYIMSQKQSLMNIESLNTEDKNFVKNNIYERVGKLTYKKNPKQAIEFISNAIVDAKNKMQREKVIELSGYLIESCKLAQKYTAIVETVDNVLELYADMQKKDVERALIKTRKLEALLHLGNFEEIVNIVNYEINPVLFEILKQKKKLPFVSKENLYNSWIKANLTLIEAYAYQGSPNGFELISNVEKELFKDGNNCDVELIKKFKLACALSNSLKGYINKSDEILHSVIKEFSNSEDDNILISKWNMITLFNKLLRLDFENIKEDLFEAVTFANNIGDNFTKNVLKTILAYVILDEGNALRSLEICQEELAYFSNEKIALGALIAWYISAKATLKISGAKKAIQICEKSVEIANGSKINSVWFRVLFRILMSRAYIINDDIESARMYSELANQEATQNEINYFILSIIRLRAIIMQESIDKAPNDKKTNIANTTVATFERALSLSSKLCLDNINYKINKELTAFRASCKLKRITLQN